MKGGYLTLSASDKNRQAACFTNIKDADIKSVMDNVRIHPHPAWAVDLGSKTDYVTLDRLETGR
jgi:hypothetical protein